MVKLLDQAVEAVRYLSPEARDDIAHVVLSPGGADAEPPVPLTPKSRPRLPIQKLPLPVANCERRTNAVGLGEAQSVRLPYTLPVLVDLRAILDYIAAHSRQSARRVQARIKALADLLLLNPYIGPRPNDPTRRRWLLVVRT